MPFRKALKRHAFPFGLLNPQNRKKNNHVNDINTDQINIDLMEVDFTFHRDAEVMPEIQNGRMETNHTVVQEGQCIRSRKSGTRHHIIEPETIAVEQDAQESDIFIGNVQPEYIHPIENYYANEKERQFEYAEDQLYWRTCSKCRESWPDLEVVNAVCKRCRTSKKGPKFFTTNLKDPGNIPQELCNMTYTEEQLITLVHPTINVYRTKGGQRRFSQNVISFPQEVLDFAKSLPHSLPSLPAIIIVNTRNSSGVNIDFRVRRQTITDALRWKKSNDPAYRHIEIDGAILASLPEDANVISSLQQVRVEFEDEINDNRTEEEPSEVVIAAGIQGYRNISTERQVRGNLNLNGPEIGSSPIDEFNTPGFIPAAFPTLFPYGYPCINDTQVKLTPTEYFRHLYRYADQRFQKHSTFLFFADNLCRRWQALALGQVYVKQNELQSWTVNDLKHRIETDPNWACKVMFYASALSGSDAYWYTRGGELQDMIKQLGPATFFFTFSAADLHNPVLERLLRHQNPTHFSRSKLLNENPGVADWFFVKRFEFYFKYVIREQFEVLHYWYRFEWQSRGSPHVHGILWIKEAPQTSYLDTRAPTPEEERNIVEFFNQHVTGVNPNIQMPPAPQHPCERRIGEVLQHEREDDLNYLVNRVQRHKHVPTCKRIIRGETVCRFNYPFKLENETHIAYDDAMNPTLLLQRNDEWLNKFNPFFLQTWRANCDFAPIISLRKLILYIAKYTTKGEKHSKNYIEIFSSILNDMNSALPAKKSITKLLMKFVSRDVSAQEVAHSILGLPYFSSSHRFVIINFKRSEWLPLAHQESDVDITETKIEKVLKIYHKRPLTQEFENLSLFSFTIKCSPNKRPGCQDYKYGQRKFPVIIRVFPKTQTGISEEQDQQHYKQLVLLHVPHRTPFNEETDWKQVYISQANTAEVPDEIFVPSEEEIAAEEGEPGEEGEDCRERIDGMAYAGLGPKSTNINEEILGERGIDKAWDWKLSMQEYTTSELKEALTFAKTLRQSTTIDHTTVAQMPTFMLSPEQLGIIDFFRNQLDEDDRTCVIIQGQGGSGKSTVIHALKAVSDAKRKQNHIEYALVAPSGVAALNIGGQTIHSFFMLPSNEMQFKELKGETRKDFEDKVKYLRVVLIDEFSMVSPNLIYMIDRRLREFFNSRIAFGGIIIYLIGDINQLPPVRQKRLYGPAKTLTLNEKRGRLLYNTYFKKAFVLCTNQRQKGDSEANFRELLLSISRGEATQSMVDLINSRSIRYNQGSNFDNAPLIANTRADVQAYNVHQLISLNKPIARIPAKDIPSLSLNNAAVETGLHDNLNLAIGCRVMLTTNLCVQAGLVNGALGTVNDIVYSQESNYPQDQPIFVLVKFDAVAAVFGSEGGLPIIPIQRHFMNRTGIKITRSQFPLNISYAITSHKAQGCTLLKAKITIGNEFTAGLLYVQLSRVTSLNGILITNMITLEQLENISKKCKDKLVEVRRLTNLN